jgi:predicted metalloprotease
VDDARGRTSGGGGGGSLGGGAIGLLTFIGRTFGIKGVVAGIVLAFVLVKCGVLDLSTLLGGGVAGPAQQTQVSQEDEERFKFVKVVLASTEDV